MIYFIYLQKLLRMTLYITLNFCYRVYDVEKKLQTPSKYLFPSFEAAHWFSASGLIQDLQTLNSSSYVPVYMIKGLKALIQALRVWFNEKDVRQSLSQSNTRLQKYADFDGLSVF